MITYAENFAIVLKPVKRNFWGNTPGQGVFGYGSKIATDRMLQFTEHPRLYRVYAICYSNAASFYIIKKGEKLFFEE